MIKLSIVIVSYNEAEYLREALDSCLSQEFAHSYEIIIGDDGSNDGSLDIIKEYEDRYPDMIRHFVMDRTDVEIRKVIPSIRVSNVMKKAFELCRGEYLAVLSGDDIFKDKKMWERDVVFLDSHKKYVACYSDFKMFWNDGTEEIHPSPLFENGSLFWGKSYVHISCFVFRRKCLNNLLDRFCDDSGLCINTHDIACVDCCTCFRTFQYRESYID